MSISVLIATYNRAPLLRLCLAQLEHQTFGPGDEVIVVDNGSSDDTAGVVRAAQARFHAALTYAVETTPGKSHALTTGLSIASGEILAFTDDDVIVADDWMAVIRSLWSDRRGDSRGAVPLGLAGGRVTPRWERPAPRWLRVQSESRYGRLAAPLALLDYGTAPVPLGRRTALGANMAVTRRALDAAGGFPPGLGKLRGTLLSGEDHQLCERVQAAGFRAVYEPRLAVQHHVPAERLRFRYHVRWFFWSGITNAALDRERAASPAPPARARYWAWRASRHAARALAAAATVRPRACAEAAVEVAFSLGYLAFTRGWMTTGTHAAAGHDGRLEAA